MKGPAVLGSDFPACGQRKGGAAMELLLVRHLWGVDLSCGFGPHLERWRRVGYRAIEGSPRRGALGEELSHVLREEGFFWIPQVFSNLQTPGGSVPEHLTSLRTQIEGCIDSQPLFFNAHTGSDTWEANEAEDFYEAILEMEASLGVLVCHETHRSRYFGNPWNTYRLLQRIPGVKLTADFSHWVCVAERLLSDAAPLISRVIQNSLHLHARVGYEQGPQVPDPRAPEWQQHLAVHEGWWEEIWSAQLARGAQVTSLTPEFGPPPYMHTLPFSQEPVADLGEVCDWMAGRQAHHFKTWSGG